MDEVNRFLDVTEHFPFAVDLKRGNRTVNGNPFLELHPLALAERWTFVHNVPEALARRSHQSLFCMR